MTSGQTQGRTGALVSGPDGALYFIPEGDLDRYRVPQDQVTKVREQLQSGDVQGFTWTQGTWQAQWWTRQWDW